MEEVQKQTDEESDQFYNDKENTLEKVLGESNGLVGHAIVSFAVGGAVDMYYYHNGILGTGFATQELIEPDGTGPVPNRLGTYELVAFTKHKYVNVPIGEGSFGKIERRICGIFTGIGNFSFQAKLEPGETCELPDNDEPNKCLIFDQYQEQGQDFIINGKEYGLLLVMEVHRDEMEYARQNGSSELLKILKQKGVYPYSDLDRESVLQ